MEQFVSVRIDWRLVKKNIVIDSAYCSWLNIWKLISLVHLRFFEFLFNLRLEKVQFILHVPIDVVKALFWMVVEAVLSFFISECRYHLTIKFLYF